MKVLVVEDEVLIAMDIETVLIEHGHLVLGPACSIVDALHLLDVECPDVALLDFNIHDQPVTPVAERLRDLGVPFIVTSSYDANELRKYDALTGAQFVKKPFDDHDLLLALTRADP